MARSINTAWLSVASSVAALVVPSAYGVVRDVNWVAVSLAAVVTVIGAPLPPMAVSVTQECPVAAASSRALEWPQFLIRS